MSQKAIVLLLLAGSCFVITLVLSAQVAAAQCKGHKADGRAITAKIRGQKTAKEQVAKRTAATHLAENAPVILNSQVQVPISSTVKEPINVIQGAENPERFLPPLRAAAVISAGLTLLFLLLAFFD